MFGAAVLQHFAQQLVGAHEADRAPARKGWQGERSRTTAASVAQAFQPADSRCFPAPLPGSHWGLEVPRTRRQECLRYRAKQVRPNLAGEDPNGVDSCRKPPPISVASETRQPLW